MKNVFFDSLPLKVEKNNNKTHGTAEPFQFSPAEPVD
jgi:hypothetical protein